MRKHQIFHIHKVSPVIRILTISDVVILSAFGFIAPIFAIFVTEEIPMATIQTAAIATAIYLFTRSIGQVPIGLYLDGKRGERDDFQAMLLGTFLFSVVPLLYIYVHEIWQLYAVQFLYGVASAIVYPSWHAIFTRHIDARHEGFEWGMYRSFLDIGSALAALIGGYLVLTIGFEYLFIIVSLVSLLGSLHLLAMRDTINKKS